MKTLYELCVPRPEAIVGTDADDVQELDQLLRGQIDPNDFFEKTFVTESMKRVFTRAFSRFTDRSVSSGLIVLKQAMGGGKTHTMIATGLLAKHPHIRQKVLGKDFPYRYDGEVRVVGFTGRWTDTLPWLEIAKQLGREDMLRKEVLMGTAAPSDREWKMLLKDAPTLILLDEIPFYFDYALSIPRGEQTLADLVKTGLANLFNAMNSDELSRVMVLLSDLEAAYEKGGEYVTNVVADALSKEAERTAEPERPVDIGGPEIYQILRRKLFKDYPQEPEKDPNVREIVLSYKDFVSELEKSGLISTGFGEPTVNYLAQTYPFHPAIVDLVKNFQNNLRFQQTRGLLRLLRRFVRYLYANDGEIAKNKYFISVTDYNLDDEDTRTLITSINPELNNALQQDIHALSGRAAAQILDKEQNTNLAGKFAKVILFASLSTTDPNAVGVYDEEIFLYALERGDRIADAKNVLEKYWSKTMFGRENDKGKKYFSYRQNVIATFNMTRTTITTEEAENKIVSVIRNFFSPQASGSVYHYVEALPSDLKALENNIRSRRDFVTLIVSKPVDPKGSLNDELREWWLSSVQWKNRILFLTGSQRYYDTLLEKTQDYIAWEKVTKNLHDTGAKETDPEYQRALKQKNQASLDIIQYMKNSFNKLYYPGYDIGQRSPSLIELEIDYSSISGQPQPVQSTFLTQSQLRGSAEQKADDIQQILQGNNRDGAVVISKSLENVKYFKFDVNDPNDMGEFLNRFKLIILGPGSTRKSITENEVFERMANNPRWIWHDLTLLDKLIEWMVSRGDWQRDGEAIILTPERIPEIRASSELQYDFQNETVKIPLYPTNVDFIYWTFGTKIDDLGKAHKETNVTELVLKPEENTTVTILPGNEERLGEPITVNIPVKTYHEKEYTNGEGSRRIVFKTLPKVKELYYTYEATADPVEQGIIAEGNEIVVPPTVEEVRFKASLDDRTIELPPIKFKITINMSKPLIFKPKSIRYVVATNMQELRRTLENLPRYNAHISEAQITFETLSETMSFTLKTKEDVYKAPEQFAELVEQISRLLVSDDDPNVNMSAQLRTLRFEGGKEFLDWIRDFSTVSLEELDLSELEQ